MTIPEAAQLVIQAGSIATGGEVFVLDMGKPVKILDLAKKMIALAGFRAVLNGKQPTNADEISINISGLRPGEKMFEELSYNDDLVQTIHQRIKKSIEQPISASALKRHLTSLSVAISDGDHRKLFNIISSITHELADVRLSQDKYMN